MRALAPQERNPFADSASMLLRIILSNPLKAWGIREVARLAGTSPTLTILTLRRLEQLGHVSRESTAEARVLDPVQLLHDWAAWYAIKTLKSYRYSMGEGVEPKAILSRISRARAQLPGQWALTSMAGASLSAPFATFSEVHIHLPRAEELKRSWQRALKLVPDPVGPIHLVQPYYEDSGLYGMQTLRRLPVVSNIQLFLDCFRYPVRGREQAEHLLSRVLLPRWKSGR